MSLSTLAQSAGSSPQLTGGDFTVVIVVAVVALVALAIGFVLRREVLAADEGPEQIEAAQGIRKAQQGDHQMYTTMNKTLTALALAASSFAVAYSSPWVSIRIDVMKSMKWRWSMSCRRAVSARAATTGCAAARSSGSRC